MLITASLHTQHWFSSWPLAVGALITMLAVAPNCAPAGYIPLPDVDPFPITTSTTTLRRNCTEDGLLLTSNKAKLALDSQDLRPPFAPKSVQYAFTSSDAD